MLDLNGNPLKLLYFLVQEGVISVKKEHYKEMAKILNKKIEKLTKQDLSEFNKLINQDINFNFGTIYIVGNELFGEGIGLYFLLKWFEVLTKNQINIEILLSTESLKFISHKENAEPFLPKSINTSISEIKEAYNCPDFLLGMQYLINKELINREEVISLLNLFYFSFLKVASYSLADNEHATIRTVAPIAERAIRVLANQLNIKIEHKISPMNEIPYFIDRLNTKFSGYLRENFADSYLITPNDMFKKICLGFVQDKINKDLNLNFICCENNSALEPNPTKKFNRDNLDIFIDFGNKLLIDELEEMPKTRALKKRRTTNGSYYALRKSKHASSDPYKNDASRRKEQRKVTYQSSPTEEKKNELLNFLRQHKLLNAFILEQIIRDDEVSNSLQKLVILTKRHPHIFSEECIHSTVKNLSCLELFLSNLLFLEKKEQLTSRRVEVMIMMQQIALLTKNNISLMVQVKEDLPIDRFFKLFLLLEKETKKQILSQENFSIICNSQFIAQILNYLTTFDGILIENKAFVIVEYIEKQISKFHQREIVKPSFRNLFFTEPPSQVQSETVKWESNKERNKSEMETIFNSVSLLK